MADGAGSSTGHDGPRRSGLEHRGHSNVARRRPGAAPGRQRGAQLGGVAIPERHSRREDEHLRLLAKQEAGCRFFVTQVVYDLNAAKNFVSDYHYECRSRGVSRVPLVFTFSVCGSMKTLAFLRWLGVDVPRWIENDLRHAADPLEASYQQALTTATELIAYCRTLDVPFGINVESVSIRRVEIEASVRLAEALRAQLKS